MKREPNHYEVLGVRMDATVDDIRRSYRNLAKATHPDAGGDSATFRQVLESYQVLTNPLQRKEYDERLGVQDRSFRAPKAPEPTGWTGSGGLFTGDVEFPAYLRDVTDAPWEGFGDDDAATESAPRAADILWWWEHQVVAHPVRAGHLVLASTEESMVALDVLGGQEVWRAGMPGGPAAAPIVVGSTVVAWTDDGTVHGLEQATGLTRWELRLGPSGPGGLALAGDTLVAAGRDRALTGVDPVTGRARWSAGTAAEVTQPLASVDGYVLVGTALGVESLDSRRGRHRWRAPSRLPVDLPLQVAGDSVWVSAGGGRLHRLSATNGSVVATWDVSTPVAGMTTDGPVLYATVAGPPQLVAVDASGWVRWATGTSMVCPEPALLAGNAYLADPLNRLVTVDTVDGRVVATSTLPFEPFGPPLAAVDRLVVRERGGYLWCTALPEG